MRARVTVTLQHLKEILIYDPATGLFTWRIRRGGKAQVGVVAGYVNQYGYRMINIDGVLYAAHRLAWFYVRGEWPEGDLDHQFRNRDDNRLDLLRPATRTQNNGNSKLRKNNTSGRKGVSWSKAAKRWTARIKAAGPYLHLGLFDSIEEATAAYDAAAVRHFGEFALTNEQLQ